MAEFADSNVLVSTDWVAQHGNDPNVQLVEVDVDTTAYETGHIAGAVDWGWQSDLKRSRPARPYRQGRPGAAPVARAESLLIPQWFSMATTTIGLLLSPTGSSRYTATKMRA